MVHEKKCLFVSSEPFPWIVDEARDVKLSVVLMGYRGEVVNGLNFNAKELHVIISFFEEYISSHPAVKPYQLRFAVEGCLTNSMKTSVLQIQVCMIYYLKYIKV